MKNNYVSKVIRTATSLLPVEDGKRGSCRLCGNCCKLPNPCAFLSYRDDKAICKIYKFRPLNCRKYPRSAKEHITNESCGYYFENDSS